MQADYESSWLLAGMEASLITCQMGTTLVNRTVKQGGPTDWYSVKFPNGGSSFPIFAGFRFNNNTITLDKSIIIAF